MALLIIEQQIICEIDNLKDKIEGKLPITREELIILVDSWGRYNYYRPKWLKEQKKCYDLSKLNVSKITNMDDIFKYSLFTDIHSTNGIGLHDGDISKWDVSNVTSMNGMFYEAIKFNADISSWDVSNVTSMSSMFFEAKSFNQNISSWNLDNIKNSYFMFNKAKAFLDKYNNGNFLPNYTEGIKEWFNLNRERMNIINVKDKHGKEIDSFFSNITDIHSRNEIGLHKDI